MSFQSVQISDSFTILPPRETEESVRTTNADFESKNERLRERNKRYKNRKNVQIKITPKNTNRLIHVMSPASTAIIASGFPILLRAFIKSL